MPYIKKPVKVHKTSKYHRVDKVDSSKYYNMSAWYKLRNQKIMDAPLDELELLEDRVVSADEVHHVRRILEGKNKKERVFYLLCYDNLLSLSRETHMKVHKHPELLTDKQLAYINDIRKKIYDKYICMNI